MSCSCIELWTNKSWKGQTGRQKKRFIGLKGSKNTETTLPLGWQRTCPLWLWTRNRVSTYTFPSEKKGASTTSWIFTHASHVLMRMHRTFDVSENWSQAVNTKSNALGTKRGRLVHMVALSFNGHKMMGSFRLVGCMHQMGSFRLVGCMHQMQRPQKEVDLFWVENSALMFTFF